MGTDTKHVRILISSPGDVAAEREKAREVILRLQPRYAGRLVLEPVLWEELALEATLSFQEGIDLVLSTEQGIDIAVFILWNRLGSPLGPTIQRADGGAYRSGTEREFDLMLAAHRKSEGERPQILAYVRRDEDAFKQLLSRTERTALAEVVAQQDLAAAFIQEQFHDADTGTNLRAYHSFAKPVDFAGRLRVHLLQVLDQLLGESTTVVWNTAVKGSPFRGLEAFDQAHADVYFGRETEVCELQEALRRQAATGCGLVLVVGASGSGKSSLVRAGLLPTLQTFDLEDGLAGWRHATIRPSDGDGDLCAALAAALRRPEALPELPAAEQADLADYLRRDPDTAWRLILKRALAEAEQVATGKLRLLLLVDQFEEVFTLPAITTEERAAFLRALGALGASGRVHVVATVRSDFYAQCQVEQGLMALVKDGGIMNLLPPDSQALHRMIQGPAVSAGLRFEQPADGSRALDARILHDAAADPQALPLLSYCLQELYDASRQSTKAGPALLTHAAYDALGGVAGAVGSRAEAVYLALPEAQRAALTGVLQALVTVRDDEAQATRRRALRAELTARPEQAALVQAFVDARLFTTDQDEAGESVVSVSHEALLSAWDRAARWIEDNREFLMTRARVAAAARLWEANARDAAYLLPAGKPLAEAEALLQRRDDLPPPVAALIDASVAHQQALADARERERQERLAEREAAAADREAAALRLRGRTRIALALGLLLTVAALIAAATAHHQRQTAHAEATRARAAETAAQQNATEAEAARADTKDFVDLFLGDEEAAKRLRGRYRERPSTASNSAVLLQYCAVNEHIGATLALQGKLDEALIAYRSSMESRRDLVSHDPSNTQWQHQLSVCVNNVSDILRRQGKVEEALQANQNCTEIWQDLAEGDPSNDKWKYLLSESHFRKGDLLKYQGKLKEAFSAFALSIKIIEDMASQDPSRSDLTHLLSRSEFRIAELLEWMDEDLLAIGYYQLSIAHAHDATAGNPNNVEWKIELILVYAKLIGRHGIDQRLSIEYAAEGTLLLQYLDAIGGLKTSQKAWQETFASFYKVLRDGRHDPGQPGPWEELMEAGDDAERLRLLRAWEDRPPTRRLLVLGARKGRPPWTRLWEAQLAGGE